MGCTLSGLTLDLSLPKIQEASLVYDAKRFGMDITLDKK